MMDGKLSGRMREKEIEYVDGQGLWLKEKLKEGR
jgi:hypothetical protein